MITEELRPMALGQIIDKTFRLAFSTIKNHLLLFLAFGGIFLVATIIMTAAIMVPIFIMEFTMGGIESNSPLYIGIIVITAILFSVVFIAASIFYYGIIYDLSIKGYLGEEWTFASSMRLIRSKFWAILFGNIITMLLITAGYMLCCIGLPPALALTAFVMPAIIYERKGPGQAVGRSFNLAGYNFWPVLGSVLLMYVVVFGLSMVLNMVMQIPMMFITPLMSSGESSIAVIIALIAFTIIFMILYLLYSIAAYIILAAFQTILYFNQRVKFENFGVERMAESLVTEESYPGGEQDSDEGSEPPQHYR